MPGEHKLYKGLSTLHKESAEGILFSDNPAVAGSTSKFSLIKEKAGPGFPITTYLPKGEKDLVQKLKPSLEPSEASKAAVAASTGKGHFCIKIREKRLNAELWKLNGKNFAGSHFPICAFTNNVGRRPPEKLEERLAKKREKTNRSGGWSGTSGGREGWEDDGNEVWDVWGGAGNHAPWQSGSAPWQDNGAWWQKGQRQQNWPQQGQQQQQGPWH